jgi:thymidylate kinase
VRGPLSGLDGSGKSTQAELISRRLMDEGYLAKTVWNRWEPMLSAPIIKLARFHLWRSERVTSATYSSFTEAKRRKMKNKWRRRFWQLMVWSEYILQVNSRLLIPLLRGTGVICDRYVYDTMIDIAINFSVPPERITDLCNHPLLALFPKPSLLIFIDIDPDTGSSRKKDGTPPEYLADRRAYYLTMARLLDMPVVDGGQSIREVQDRIWELTGDWRKSLRMSARGGAVTGRNG